MPGLSPEGLLGGVMVLVGASLGAGAVTLSGETTTVLVILLAFAAISAGLGLVVLLSGGGTRQTPVNGTFCVRISTVDGEKSRVTGLDPQTARRLADAISAATARR